MRLSPILAGRSRRLLLRSRFPFLWLVVLAFAGSLVALAAGSGDLARSLTFYASFDNGLNADFALGDPQLYSAQNGPAGSRSGPGLPIDGPVELARGQGRFGDALFFRRKSPLVVFYKGAGNIEYQPRNWDGTVSFWLRLNPETDLEPGYTDPLQITARAWNDAAFFVEFGKDESPRHFRLGVYPDLGVWNPQNRDWAAIPMREKPLVSVLQPRFRRDRWTHVVFTFRHFNTHQADGIATLYLDGERIGSITGREQTFTWNPAHVRIMPGLSYVGYFDELAIFNRALDRDEIQRLHRLRHGLRSLPAP